MPNRKGSKVVPLNNDFVPYYYQIANILERKIEQGEFEPGAKLPGESRLEEMFKVSRISIRRALSVLEDKGLLLRKHGSGTYVAPDIKISKTIKLTGVTEDYRIWGSQGELRLISVNPFQANAEFANFFRARSKKRLVKIERLRLIDGTPYCHIFHYLPEKTFLKIPTEDLQNHPIVLIFEKRIRIPVSHIRQTVEARIVDRKAAAYLGIKPNDPVVYVETYMYDEKGNPLGISQRQFRADRFHYSMEIRRNKEVGQEGSFIMSAHFPGPRYDGKAEDQ